MARRAQSALEYLTTYGWALLAIAIIGIALWKLGIFSPAAKEGVVRQPTKDFNFGAFTMDPSKARLVLYNVAGEQVWVYSIVWEDPKGVIRYEFSNPNGTTIPAGGSYTFDLSAVRNCSSGTLYNVKVTITYTKESITWNDTAEGWIAVKCK